MTTRFEQMSERLIATGVYTVDDLVVIWNCDPDDVRAFLRSSERSDHMFVLTNSSGTAIVPAVFFDANMCLRVELFAVLAQLRAHGFSSWRSWAWLMSPERTVLGGRTPHEAMLNPVNFDVVVAAARGAGSVGWLPVAATLRVPTPA